MKQQTKLSPKQEQVAQQQTGHEALKEFASSDELLRFDAAQTAVPPEIAQRLAKTSAQIPSPGRRPWWKAWLGR